MSSAARDRSARSRIREYLTNRGPVEDASGRATSVLKDAIKYDGSSVAFIQLVTAMDKANEIEREIRGKRTYKISVAGAGRSAAPQPARAGGSLLVGDMSTQGAIDYDELARALLRELARAVAGSTALAASAETPDGVRVERERLMAERDEYARRLQIARQQLNALLSESAPAGEVGVDLFGVHEAGRVEQAS